MQYEFQHRDFLVMIESRINPRTELHCSECTLSIYENGKSRTSSGIFERRFKPDGKFPPETEIVEYDSAEESIKGATRFMKLYIDKYCY